MAAEKYTNKGQPGTNNNGDLTCRPPFSFAPCPYARTHTEGRHVQFVAYTLVLATLVLIVMFFTFVASIDGCTHPQMDTALELRHLARL